VDEKRSSIVLHTTENVQKKKRPLMQHSADGWSIVSALAASLACVICFLSDSSQEGATSAVLAASEAPFVPWSPGRTRGAARTFYFRVISSLLPRTPRSRKSGLAPIAVVKKIDETITIHKQCSCCMCERTSCCCCYCMCDSPAVNPELAVETLLSHVPSLWI